MCVCGVQILARAKIPPPDVARLSFPFAYSVAGAMS